MVTLSSPTHNPETDEPVDPELHKKVYGAVPPLGETFAVPSQIPLQVASVDDELAVILSFCPTTILVAKTQLIASVTVKS